MRRGFFFGLLSGTIFGVIVLALTSLLSEVPGIRGPDATFDAAAATAPEVAPSPDVAEPTAESRPDTTVSTVGSEEADSSALTAFLGPEVTSPGVQPQPTIETSAFSELPQAPGEVPSQEIDESAVDNRDAPNLANQTLAPVQLAEEQPLIETSPADEPAPKPEPEVEAAPETEAVPETEAAPEPPVETSIAATTQPEAEKPETALESFAAPFERTDNRPLYSIVILDDASSGIGPSALDSFPLPLTIAIDPTGPNAQDRMFDFASAGFEIVIQSPLSGNVNASDLAQLSQSLPLSVAYVAENASAFGGVATRDASDALSGLGLGLLVLDDRGGIAGLARSAGVPSAVPVVDLDAKNQSSATIRRFMDQAAFKARQEGSAVIIARLRPATISAFLIWAQQSRVDTVAVAPLSAVLLEK